ncbi:MAG: DNA-binding FrmR family transcriptional regulator [Myxococcota bacterium]|jgi:DNA-binding FrmR family transcriptional regulator
MTKKTKECCDKNHPDNSKELTRLKKISGQILGIQKMIEDKRYCMDILQQLNAVKSAVISVQAEILETHLNSCVRETLSLKNDSDIEKKIDELKNIFKKY